MKKKILIIDDEEDIRDVLQMALEDNGFDTLSAGDGAEGLEKIESYGPDLILLDLMMEGMDGVTMKKRMKKDIPVIVISAVDEKIRAGVEKVLNARSWLEKPFDVDGLITEVKRILGEN